MRGTWEHVSKNILPRATALHAPGVEDECAPKATRVISGGGLCPRRYWRYSKNPPFGRTDICLEDTAGFSNQVKSEEDRKRHWEGSGSLGALEKPHPLRCHNIKLKPEGTLQRMDMTEKHVGDDGQPSRIASPAVIPSFHPRSVFMRVFKRIPAPSLGNLSVRGKTARDFIL